MRKGIIMMTALVPTTGHAYLIDWADRYLQSIEPAASLHVIVMSRDCEPVSGVERLAALKAHFNGRFIDFHLHHESVPQNPNEHPEFWDIMVGIVRRYTRFNSDSIVFASETYGVRLAEVMACQFIPCDIARDVVSARGTDVRIDPIGNFAAILPEFQPQLRRTVTFFGAESCGKTTMSRRMAAAFGGYWAPEWARPYLEVAGPKVTDAKMAAIVAGQFATQTAIAAMRGRPFIIQDTDLLSTLGYYDLWKGEHPDNVEALFKANRSHLYILMNDGIPFEPDPLRYGGDKRETDDLYWRKLLHAYGCRYHHVQTTDREEQAVEIFNVLRSDFMDNAKHISSFVRT